MWSLDENIERAMQRAGNIVVLDVQYNHAQRRGGKRVFILNAMYASMAL